MKLLQTNPFWKEVLNRDSIITGLVLALFLYQFLNFAHFLIIPIFLVILLVLDKTDIILLIIISSFLIITRALGDNFRDLLQYLNFIILGILVVKRNHNKVILFPSISKELIQFLVIYFVALFISSIFAEQLFTGWQHIFRQVIFFLMIYIIYSFIESNRTVIYLLISISIAALFHTLVNIYAFYEHNFDILAFGNDYFLSLGTDLLSHKNTIGVYIFYALIFSITYIQIAKYSFVKVLIILQIFILSLGLLLLNSRGLILSIVVTGFYLLFNLKRKIFYYSTLILTVIIILLFIPPLDTITNLYFRLDKISAGRDMITNTTMSLIEHEWLLGTGPAGTRDKLYNYLPYMLGSPEEIWIRHHFNQIEFGHAHNYFLFMLSDLGILGLLSSIFLIYAYMRIGNRVYRYYQKADSKSAILILVIISLGIGMFVRGLLEWGGILGYGILATDLPFWITFSVLVYYDRKRNEEITGPILNTIKHSSSMF